VASANTRLDSLGDLIKHQANLMVRCRCGSEHIVDAERFRRYCRLRGWNNQLEALRTRLRCRGCGRRPDRVRATPSPATLADPFPRTERDWQALQKRMRD
jgi:hypothetical protein